jgi:hypothetical protein
MSKDRTAERREALAAMSEAIAALMYAIQADPDEEFAPYLIAPNAAYAAMSALEAAGFTVEKRGR